MSLMVVVSAGMTRRVFAEDIPDYVKGAGVKLIKLRHKKGFSNVPVAVRGFQGVTVRAHEGQGGRHLEAEFDIDKRTGQACMAARSLEFEPNKRSGLLEAYLPDTPFNRKKLAAQMYHAPYCDIEDDAIAAEIKALADEIEAALPEKETPETINRALQEENEKLKKMLADAEISKAALASAPITEKREVLTENTELNSEETVEPTGKISEKTDEQFRAEAKHYVMLNNAKTINALKKKYGDEGYVKSKGYREKILPLINEKQKELKDAYNSTVGVDNKE